MTRNLKPLGLGLAAVFAFAAIAASSASAAAFKCESTNQKCILTGTTETTVQHERLFSGGSEPLIVECHGKFSATQGTASVASLTVTPAYTECTNGEHVRTNHCAYIFSVTTTNGDGAVELECETGSKIEVDRTGICTLTFGTQTPNGGVHYVNTGGQVTAESTVTNVTYTKGNHTGNQFFCFGIPNGPGEYTSKVTLTCYEDKAGAALSGTGKTTPSYTADDENSGTAANCSYEAYFW